MAYSAGSGGPPPSTTQSTGQTNTQASNQSNTTSYQSSNQSNTSTYQSEGTMAGSTLQAFFATRKNKMPLINPKVNAIQRLSQRAVKNQIAKKNEFYDGNSKMVKEGTVYHIHQTRGITEHYMTGGEHNSLSKLIYPMSNDVSDFALYNSLNKQSPMKLKSTTTLPTENDYKKKRYTRYFAKQSNDKNEPAFEISKGNSGRSPLYNYTEIVWHITGDKDIVYSKNIKAIKNASFNIPSIKKILTPFQFYRFIENLSDADALRKKLGMMDLSGYNTTTQSSAFGTNTGGGGAGTCSLGPQYTSKAACEAAGGNWTDSNPSGFDVNGDEVLPPKMC